MTYRIIEESIFVKKKDDNIPYGNTYSTLGELKDAISQLDSMWSYEFMNLILIYGIVRWPSKYNDKPRMREKNTVLVAQVQHDYDVLDIDTVHNDPLPPHEPDGYWSGYRVNDMWVKDGTKALGYAEDDDIPALAQEYAEYPITIVTNDHRKCDIQNDDELARYVRNVATVGLIDGTDNYIRYAWLNSHCGSEDDVIGMFVCRCGDCGRKAQGIFRGNPDMGDSCYQTLHRKDWFCSNFKWTYMGGHGYPGGRRMICPECSKVYEQAEKKKLDTALTERRYRE